MYTLTPSTSTDKIVEVLLYDLPVVSSLYVIILKL